MQSIIENYNFSEEGRTYYCEMYENKQFMKNLSVKKLFEWWSPVSNTSAAVK